MLCRRLCAHSFHVALAQSNSTDTVQETSFALCVAGLPIKTTMDNSTTVQYASVLCQFTAKARSGVRDIDPQNDLTFIRIRTKKHEIMIAPGTIPQFSCTHVSTLSRNHGQQCFVCFSTNLCVFYNQMANTF